MIEKNIRFLILRSHFFGGFVFFLYLCTRNVLPTEWKEWLPPRKVKQSNDKRQTTNDKQVNIIQLIIAALVVLSGIALLFVGVKCDPAGEIHETVLIAFGEAATFAGSIIGIDYRYKSKYQNPDQNPNNNDPQDNTRS